MTLIVGLRYLAVSGGFARLTARRSPGLYGGRAKQIRKEFDWSLASAAIYGLPAGRLITASHQERHDRPYQRSASGRPLSRP